MRVIQWEGCLQPVPLHFGQVFILFGIPALRKILPHPLHFGQSCFGSKKGSFLVFIVSL